MPRTRRRASGATRRGLANYHHFPHGKLQLATEVVDLTGGRIAEIVEAECVAHQPREAVRRLLGIAERIMFEPDLRPGCPVAAVTLAADDPEGQLRTTAAYIFDRWRAALADCLVRADVARVVLLRLSLAQLRVMGNWEGTHGGSPGMVMTGRW